MLDIIIEFDAENNILKFIMKLNVLGIIPARSGSKGKNKNIKKLGKYPLIYYTICQSIKSKIFKDIIISRSKNI